MVLEHSHAKTSRCYEEEHKRHPEARKNSFKAAQEFAMGRKRSKTTTTQSSNGSYGSWGPVFKNKENFVDMHMF